MENQLRGIAEKNKGKIATGIAGGIVTILITLAQLMTANTTIENNISDFSIGIIEESAKNQQRLDDHIKRFERSENKIEQFMKDHKR